MSWKLAANFGSLVLMTAVLVPSAGANNQYFDEAHAKPIPIDPAPATLGRAVVGDFTGDRYPDVMIMNGQTPTLVYGPSAFTFVDDHPGTANDLASVVGGGPSGTDSLLMVNGSGLVHSWFTHGTGFVTTTLHSSSGWPGAQRVKVLDDSGGSVDVVAVASNGSNLLVLQDVLGTPSFPVTVSVGATISDIAVLDFIGNSDPEIAVLIPGALRIYSASGALISSTPHTATGGLLQRFRQAGFWYDRLAFVVTNPSGHQWFGVLDQTSIEPLYGLGSAGVVGIAAADVDLDGDDDLVLNHQASYVMPFLENISTGSPPSGLPSFSFTTSDDIDLGYGVGPAPQQAGQPVLADLNSDTDIDLILPIQEHAVVSSVDSETNGHDQGRRVGVQYVEYAHDYSAGSGTLHLDVDEPANGSAGFSHLEIVVWKRDNLSSVISSDACTRELVPVPSTWPLSVDLEFDEPSIHMQTIYYLQFRLVTLNAGGELTDASVVTTHSLATDTATNHALETSADGPGDTLSLIIDPQDPIFPGDDPDLGGAVHPYDDPGEYDRQKAPDPNAGSSEA